MKGAPHSRKQVNFIVDKYDADGHGAGSFPAACAAVFLCLSKSNLLLSRMRVPWKVPTTENSIYSVAAAVAN
jgi:hypothetical protein